MKLKSILLIVSAAGMLFSCTKDIIDNNPPVPEDGAVMLSLAVSPEDVIVSRADSYEGEDGKVYYPATNAEKTIDHCLLVVFDSEDKVYSWYKYGPEEETALGTPDANFVYTLTGVKAKAGDTRFLVIANGTSDYDDLLVKGIPYSDFSDEDLIETDAEATFTPSLLVKVGRLEKEISATDKMVKIPLTQLAARVDVTFEFAPAGVDLSTITTEVSAEALNSIYQKETYIGQWTVGRWETLTLTYEGQDFPVEVYYDNLGGEISGDDYFYYKENSGGGYDKVTGWGSINNPKGISMQEIYYKIRTETNGWAVKVSDVTIHNIETESSVILNYDDDKLNAKKTLISKTVTATRLAGTHSYTFSFYTYEKKYVEDGNLDEVLHLTFTAAWENGEKITEQLARYTLEGGDKFYLLASESKDGPPANGNASYLIPVYSNGWDELTDGQIAELVAVGDEVEVEDGIINTINSTYRIKINPVADATSTSADGTPKKFTDGLIHGNIYLVSGKITAMPSIPVQDIEFEYAVVPWNTKGIDIPVFE